MSSSDPAPSIPPPPGAIVSTYRSYYYGLISSLILFGLMLSQAWTFFNLPGQGRTRTKVKLFVIFVLLVATVLTGMDIFLVDFFMIQSAGNFGALGDPQQFRTLIMSLLLYDLNLFLVQLFFAYQVFSVTRTTRSWLRIFVVIVIVALSLTTLVTNIVGGTLAWIDPQYAGTNSASVLVGVSSVASTLTDLSASIYLTVSLFRARTGVKSTTHLIKLIAFYALQRGILVTIFQMLVFLTKLVKPNQLIWLSFDMVLSKLYVNTTLAMLNARASWRPADGTITNESIILPSITPQTTRKIQISERVDIRVTRDQDIATDFAKPTSSYYEGQEIEGRDKSQSDDSKLY